MNIFRNIVIGICIILGILMTVDYIRIKKQINEFRKDIVEIHDTIVKTRVDSIFYQSPIVYKVKEIRRDTAQVWSPHEQDSVQVELPYIQKEYRDSTYSAWVSGYQDVNLDSIRIFQHNKIVYINNNIERIKYKNKHWHIGPSVGVGYDFINNRVAPYLGVSVQYSIFSW